MIREKLKKYAIKHVGLLTIYRKTIGKIKTKYYFNAQRKALLSKAESLIRKIDEALKLANAQYFIDCGTLLGFVRDNGPIASDRDIDFGIWFDDDFTPLMLINEMEKLGLKRISTSWFSDEIQEITFSSGITDIDFFRHTEAENESWLYVFYRDITKDYPTDKHCSVIKQRRIHISGLKRVQIGGVETNIPANYEEYLTSAYTENWRIPDPNWRYTMEPGCTYMDEFGYRK